jgi:hypothetical protein
MKIILTYLANRLKDVDLAGWPATLGFLALIIYVMGSGLWMISKSLYAYLEVMQ